MADNQSIQDRAGKAAKAVFDNVNAQTGSCWLAGAVAGLVWLIYYVIGDVAIIVTWVVVNIGAPIAEAIVEAFNTLRNAPSPAINELIVEVMGEFFGAEFDTSNLSVVPGQSTNLQNMQAIGSDIFNLLEGEFAPAGTIGEDQGQLAAEAFMGFATNFAVRSAFVGIVGELLSLGIVTDFRELGENVAQNLGLGRLIRRALQPLIMTTISTPLQWKLNRKYRPHRLSEPELFHQLNNGVIDSGDFVDAMQQHGYRDEDIQSFIDISGLKFAPAEVFALERYQILDKDTAVQRLAEAGWKLDAATQELISEDCKRADHWVMEYLNHVVKSYIAGTIDDLTLDGFIQAAPIGDIERQWIKISAVQQAKVPHRELTVGTITKALEQNVFTIGDFEDYLLKLGFTPSDVFTLLELAELAEAKAAAKAKAAKKAAGSGATAPVAPVTPTTPKP